MKIRKILMWLTQIQMQIYASIVNKRWINADELEEIMRGN
jgi:hypothetical protein